MLCRRTLLLSLKRSNDGVVQFVKVHVDAIMLLRLPGDEGYVFEFMEETLTGSGRRISGPTVSNLKV